MKIHLKCRPQIEAISVDQLEHRDWLMSHFVSSFSLLSALVIRRTEVTPHERHAVSNHIDTSGLFDHKVVQAEQQWNNALLDFCERNPPVPGGFT